MINNDDFNIDMSYSKYVCSIQVRYLGVSLYSKKTALRRTCYSIHEEWEGSEETKRTWKILKEEAKISLKVLRCIWKTDRKITGNEMKEVDACSEVVTGIARLWFMSLYSKPDKVAMGICTLFQNQWNRI